MSLRVECLTIDARDPESAAAFWLELLGWEREGGDDDGVFIRPAGGAGAAATGGILFFRVPADEEKVVKNRLHLDLRPDDQDAEVERALALGARRVDIGQGDESWVVLADPDGNEFCILRPER